MSVFIRDVFDFDFSVILTSQKELGIVSSSSVFGRVYEGFLFKKKRFGKTQQ